MAPASPASCHESCYCYFLFHHGKGLLDRVDSGSDVSIILSCTPPTWFLSLMCCYADGCSASGNGHICVQRPVRRAGGHSRWKQRGYSPIRAVALINIQKRFVGGLCNLYRSAHVTNITHITQITQITQDQCLR
jgi:hypothetical protein